MFAKNEHIGLRAAEPFDAQQIYFWENNQNVWRVSDTIVPYSLFQIEQFLINNNDVYANRQIRLMIETIKKQITIGCIDIYDLDPYHQRAGIGILIDESMRRKGFASEAIELLEKYIFDDLLLHQIYCYIGEYNEVSVSLFEKLGYQRCGHRKEWLKTENGFVDQFEYQKLNPKR